MMHERGKVTRCAFSEMKPTDELVPHERNPNRHSEEQIQRLAKLIDYQGFRHPIIVSKRSGKIVAGHARLSAAKLLGLQTVPIDYQEFESDESEYAFLISDNGIQDFSSLDFAEISEIMVTLGPDFELDLLGVKDFAIDPQFAPSNEEDQPRLDEKKPVQCPNCGEQFVPKS